MSIREDLEPKERAERPVRPRDGTSEAFEATQMQTSRSMRHLIPSRRVQRHRCCPHKHLSPSQDYIERRVGFLGAVREDMIEQHRRTIMDVTQTAKEVATHFQSQKARGAATNIHRLPPTTCSCQETDDPSETGNVNLLRDAQQRRGQQIQAIDERENRDILELRDQHICDADVKVKLTYWATKGLMTFWWRKRTRSATVTSKAHDLGS